MEISKLVTGKIYRVVKGGCSLTVLESAGYGTWKYIRKKLRKGDLVKYQGKEPNGWGRDKIDGDVFSKDKFRGWFKPYDLATGSMNVNCLAEVDNPE